MLNAVNWTARLNELATEANVPGAALGIWSDGQEILAAHGVLNSATQVPVTTDSVCQVGSITKIWTATMIMQLVDEGLVSLNTTVSEVLPGARLGTADVADQVTVRHLLTHTSGIDGDIFTDTGRGDECIERYVGLLGEAPSVFTPGAAYSYCNSGYVLLGRIIEVLDGRSWDESLRERLTGPLSAIHTVTPDHRRPRRGHHRPVRLPADRSRGRDSRLPADQLRRIRDLVPGAVQRGVRGPDRRDDARGAVSRARGARVGLRSRGGRPSRMPRGSQPRPVRRPLRAHVPAVRRVGP
jgi:CubicO group peptidase (beta-lactamase class C family)